MPDTPKGRPLRKRLSEWLAVRADVLDVPVKIRTLILDLTEDEPQRRSTLSNAKDALAASPSWLGHKAHDEERRLNGGLLGEDQWQEAVNGIVDFLLDSMNLADSERLWPLPRSHELADPCAVHYGAAGVLGVLTRYFELTGDQRLPEVIAMAGTWITRRLGADAQRAPGLHSGEAGVAWSLYDAGRALGEDALIQQGLTLAETLPVSSPNPDLISGTAGIGLALLHLWSNTGHKEFVTHAHKSADALLASAEESNGLSWLSPTTSEFYFARDRYHGYAHGTTATPPPCRLGATGRLTG